MKSELQSLYNSIKVLTYVVDVSKPDEVHKCGDELKKELEDDYVSILFNNAGVASKKTILEMTTQEIDKTLSINTNGYLYTIKEFLPNMIKHNDGFLIHTSSVAGFTPAPHLVYEFIYIYI